MASIDPIAPGPIAQDDPIATPPRRYTLDGDADVEARIERDQRLIAEAVTAVIDPARFVALVMMGGYGRGEGGYVSIDGEPAPYNDYDYFVVVANTDSAVRAALAQGLAEAANRLESEVGVEVDFALLRAERLRAAEFSLMNAEMRWGHRVVAGDQNVLSAMRPMPFHRLPPGEITRLMLNRGSLLLMNQRRLQQGGLSAAEREVHFKYLFKAVLACGDARLARFGRYHPSYPVKLERLQAGAGQAGSGGAAAGLPDADKFLELYQLAYRNKFHPDYGAFGHDSPADWQVRVVRAWLVTLRAFETHRRGRGFDGWNDYCRASLGKGQSGNLPRNLAVTLRDFGARELLSRPGRSLRYPRERLISALPLLLSEPGSLLDPCVANALAVTPQTSWRKAAQVFLQQWKRYA